MLLGYGDSMRRMYERVLDVDSRRYYDSGTEWKSPTERIGNDRFSGPASLSTVFALERGSVLTLNMRVPCYFGSLRIGATQKFEVSSLRVDTRSDWALATMV
jgi:hypothetical protein